MMWLDFFENRNFNAQNNNNNIIYIINIIIAGRLKFCGIEDVRSSMLCGLWLPEGKKLLCDMEGENVLSYGRLPAPAPYNRKFWDWSNEETFNKVVNDSS